MTNGADVIRMPWLRFPPLGGGSFRAVCVVESELFREHLHLLGGAVVENRDLQMWVIDFGGGFKGRANDLHRLAADRDQQIDVWRFAFPIHAFQRMEPLLREHVAPHEHAHEADQLGHEKRAGGHGVLPVCHRDQPVKVDQPRTNGENVEHPIAASVAGEFGVVVPPRAAFRNGVHG